MKPDNTAAALLGLAICWGAGAASSPAAAEQCPRLAWHDEFDGAALDLGRWSHQLGDGCAEGICGWGNNEEQTYRSENVAVEGGRLKITARKERVSDKSYTSGRIRSLGKGDFVRGRFEARIKMTSGRGLWPAFWMLPTDEVHGGWPASGEIDIMENVGSEPHTVLGTIHYGGPSSSHQQSGASFRRSGGAFADGFHDFAIEKEAGAIRWLVDDVLFFSRTPSDLAPARWPFDERFHFLLNVAVGGNLPGSPDSSTVFPQTLEVDYVRVWDRNLPHLAGRRRVDSRAAGVVYSVGNAFSGSTFRWTVPAGATLVSGQGTASITVDWGTSGGPVTVDLASGCGDEQLALDVTVDPPYVPDLTYESFDDPAGVTVGFVTGTLVQVPNPDPSGINPSALSGRYTRNAGEVYDVLFYDVAEIGDASEYASERKRFSVDVYTGVAPGTQVLLQLEDSERATPDNFPTGRHSRYRAYTTQQNRWERLTLHYLDSPDPDTPDGSIDAMVLLFAPGTNTGDTWHFDNLGAYRVGPESRRPLPPRPD